MTNRDSQEWTAATTSAGVIGLTALGGAVIGFILQLLLAFFFGASADTDAYFMAQSTSELLSKLLLGGSITAVFLPMFVARMTRGQLGEAWHLSLNILHVTALVFMIAIAALFLAAEPFIRFIAPGFSPGTQDLTVSLLRVLLPSFLFLFLVDLAVAMLHSLKAFALPALLRVVAPSVSIVSLILFARALGIYALAIGAVAGSVLQLALVGWALYRHGWRYHLVFDPFSPAIKNLVRLLYPFVLAVVVTQGAGIVYRVLVSELSTGSLSALKFAEKITQLLTIVFLTSITTVMYPLLSEKASRQDFAGMSETIGRAFRLIIFITLPLIVGVAALRRELIAVVYERGSFSFEDARLTSIALLWLVIGLTINGLSSVLGHTTLALQQTKVAVAVTVASQAVAIALFVLLVPRLGLAGLALASSLVPISIALLHFLYLRRFIPGLGNALWHVTYVKTAILSAVIWLVIFGLRPVVAQVPAGGELAKVVALAVPSLAAAGAFWAAARWWRLPEMSHVSAILAQKFLKFRRAK